MAESKNPFRNLRVEYRPADPKVRRLLILLILASLAALITLYFVHRDIQAGTQEILWEAYGLEEDNADLQDRIENPDSAENIAAIAQEELGLVDPDSVIINPDSQ